jgi:glycosyltransferase involved in cell wall biosynthesis
MARVLHVTQPTAGGVAGVVIALAALQQRQGWNVTVASPATEPFVARIRAAGAAHVAWHAMRSPAITIARETISLARVVDRTRPDVIHLHSSKAGLTGRLSRRRAPIVFQPHAWSFEAGFPRAARAWEGWAARRADVVVCVSEAERERARDFPARFEVIPCGVDLESFVPSDRAAARAALGLSDGPLALCVGRVCRQKGQDVLLLAWPLVTAAVPGAHLVIVGDGPDRHKLASQTPADVHWVGADDDVAPWLAAADVVVVPSRWDGMSLVVLEAMAAGRSIVAADVDGVREALGATGVVPSEDHRALAHAVAARLQDPDLAAQDGAANRARAEAHHGLVEQVAKLSAVDAGLVR